MYMMREFNQKVSTWSVIIFIFCSKKGLFSNNVNMIQETLWNWIYAFLLVITLHDMKANTVKTSLLQIIIETKWDSYDKKFESSEE